MHGRGLFEKDVVFEDDNDDDDSDAELLQALFHAEWHGAIRLRTLGADMSLSFVPNTCPMGAKAPRDVPQNEMQRLKGKFTRNIFFFFLHAVFQHQIHDKMLKATIFLQPK